MKHTYTMKIFVPKEKEDYYYEVPFTVPPDVYKIDVRYFYERFQTTVLKSGWEAVEEKNIIDLSLCAPDGNYLGSSGADRDHITISESYSTPGYATTCVVPGQWFVIVGAAVVCPEGVAVTYEFTFTQKEPMLLKGDLHCHTIFSDGYLSIDELTDKAVKNGLEFLCITDHNNFVQNQQIRPRPDITVIPGCEWTHFKGHIGMIGVNKPFQGPFYANTVEEVKEKIAEAKGNGAVTILNHPYLSGTAFRFGIDNVSCDCVEIWNGPFVDDMEVCLDWWQKKLLAGDRIVVTGSSDYHHDEPGRHQGAPCTCVYTHSNAPSDILADIKAGHCFVSRDASGPEASISCKGKIMGDIVEGNDANDVCITLSHLKMGDVLKIIADDEIETITISEKATNITLTKKVSEKRFLRLEVHRPYLHGEAPRMAMLSNPIFFTLNRC